MRHDEGSPPHSITYGTSSPTIVGERQPRRRLSASFLPGADSCSSAGSRGHQSREPPRHEQRRLQRDRSGSRRPASRQEARSGRCGIAVTMWRIAGRKRLASVVRDRAGPRDDQRHRENAARHRRKQPARRPPARRQLAAREREVQRHPRPAQSHDQVALADEPVLMKSGMALTTASAMISRPSRAMQQRGVEVRYEVRLPSTIHGPYDSAITARRARGTTIGSGAVEDGRRRPQANARMGQPTSGRSPRRARANATPLQNTRRGRAAALRIEHAVGPEARVEIVVERFDPDDGEHDAAEPVQNIPVSSTRIAYAHAAPAVGHQPRVEEEAIAHRHDANEPRRTPESRGATPGEVKGAPTARARLAGVTARSSTKPRRAGRATRLEVRPDFQRLAAQVAAHERQRVISLTSPPAAGSERRGCSR